MEPHELPIRRLERLGAAPLSNAELVALISSHGREVTDTDRELAADPIRFLGGLSLQEVCARYSITPMRAARIVAGIELGRRVVANEGQVPARFDSPDAVAAYLLPRHSTYANEVFGVLALDSRHRLIGERIVATGGRHAVAVTPADVFRAALPYGPRCVVVFHNHPSGEPQPSEEDKMLTHRIVRAGEILGIPAVDHVILGARSFFSFRQGGLI